MTEKTEKKDRRPKGRPVSNRVPVLPATAEKIAQTIFHAADKKIKK